MLMAHQHFPLSKDHTNGYLKSDLQLPDASPSGADFMVRGKRKAQAAAAGGKHLRLPHQLLPPTRQSPVPLWCPIFLVRHLSTSSQLTSWTIPRRKIPWCPSNLFPLLV